MDPASSERSRFRFFLKPCRGTVTFSASIFRRATNQPAIPNRRAYAKWKETFYCQRNDLANDSQRHLPKESDVTLATPQAAFHGESLARAQNPREMWSLRRTSVVVKSPVELNAKLPNPGRTGTANNPKRRAADVSSGIPKLRVVEDVEKFDSKIESQILFDHGVL